MSTLPELWSERIDVAFQLADVVRGLEYLHKWPSVHADLKSVSQISEDLIWLQSDNVKSSVLIDSDHTARIADLGLTSLF